jgi:hypothetical protein
MWLATASLLATPAAGGPPQTQGQVQVSLDMDEARAAVALIEALAAGRTPDEAEWQALFASQGYRRLKQREAAMKRDFTDAEFRAFLSAPETRARAASLRAALDRWQADPSGAAAARALAYLPPGTTLRATIFPMVKPKPNEFVFDLAGDPAIFLMLNPAVLPEKAANTLAHELHHIGMGAACGARSPDGESARRLLLGWLSAYGEGLAMLAAAGGPAIHPHADSDAGERAEWDRNAASFATEMAEQDAWFRSVLAGTAGDEAAIAAKMRGYFGTQGPWYTVGWRMARTIEINLGRARTIDAFCRPATLLATYNQAAALQERRGGTRLPRWDATLAARLAGPPTGRRASACAAARHDA